MHSPSSRTKFLLALLAVVCIAAAILYWFYLAPLGRAKASAGRHEALAADALKSGDVSGVESQLLAAIAAWPEDVDAYIALGDFYRSFGQPEVAATAYQEALRLAPDYPDAYTRLSLVAYDAGLEREAYGAAQQELSHHPNSVEALDMLARLDQHAGKLKEARTEAERAYRLQPGTEETTLVYAETYLPEDPAGAAKILSQAQRALPNSWALAYKLGWCLARLSSKPEDMEHTVQLLKGAALLRPSAGVVHSELSSLYVKQNKIPDAIQEANLAVQLNPYDAQGYFNQSQALRRGGEAAAADTAMTHFQTLQANEQRRTALQRQFAALPGDISIARELVAVDQKIGDSRDALVALQVAQSRHPDDKQIAAELARVQQ